MQLLTFLGTGKYSPTCYTWQEREKKTAYIAEALCEFFKPTSVRAFVTPEAREMHGEQLKGCLQDLDFDFIPIPSGKSETEIWQIFEAVVNSVEPGSQVIFDITHAFRSIPLLVLLASAFLQKARNVQIKGVYYGAFEVNRDRPPVFDITPAIKLLDWLTATDQFIKTGNGQELASLLRQSDRNENQNLAQSIEVIAGGLQLLRPMDVMAEAAALPKNIEMAAPNISQSVPPFVTLLNQIEQGYGNFALANPTDYATHAKESLLQQLKIIEWYADKGQFVQALSLAREWLPSLLCYHFNLDPLVNKPNREEMELLLTGGKIKDSEGNLVKESSYLEAWQQIPKSQRKQLTRLWGGTFNLANLRNDVLHAGFRKNPKDAKQIKEEVATIIAELKTIKEAWKLES